ncbi:hypothetical protein BpHYR1_021334 [Brachionus plicatilis]|uniref:Uncharacterized protein n=1 Tax=Brachionus plicatilis TaxID=10195 RepID=A0A3M7Q9V5_BRAPC|nr:hypothetical protein BpHYR1_021334 [Brachionus plicatilis]
MLHSTGFDCLLNAFFGANLAASDDSTGTKAISLLTIVYFKPVTIGSSDKKMIFFMVPISKDYLEKLSVQELVHLIKTQNGSFENEFQKLDDDSELVSCTEAELMEWLQNVQNSGKSKKLLIELLFKRAELLASIKKMKIEEDSFRNINQSKKSEEGAKSTLQEIATLSKTLIHEDEKFSFILYLNFTIPSKF